MTFDEACLILARMHDLLVKIEENTRKPKPKSVQKEMVQPVDKYEPPKEIIVQEGIADKLFKLKNCSMETINVYIEMAIDWMKANPKASKDSGYILRLARVLKFMDKVPNRTMQEQNLIEQDNGQIRREI